MEGYPSLYFLCAKYSLFNSCTRQLLSSAVNVKVAKALSQQLKMLDVSVIKIILEIFIEILLYQDLTLQDF